MKIIRDKNHIKIMGDFKSYYLVLIFPFGSEDDPVKSYGLAHMCEHYILQSLKEYISKDITIYGRTDFDYMICLLRLSNFEDLNKAIQGITRKVYLNIDYKIFNHVKKEIMSEFLKKSSIKEVLFRFISDGHIDHLPIGNKSEMESIELAILEKHLNKFYHNNSCIYIGNREIELEYTGVRIKKEKHNFSYQESKYLSLQNLDGNCEYISIYFINMLRNDIKFCLFGILMNSILPQRMLLEYKVYNKRINGNISLFYFSFNNIKKVSVVQQVNFLLNKIKEYTFVKDDIDEATKIIEKAIKPLKEKDIQELIETFITETLYGEKGIFNSKDVKDIINDLKNINEEDMNIMKYDILKSEYHVTYK